jgi:mono/diheme cytochrome c family protein
MVRYASGALILVLAIAAASGTTTKAADAPPTYTKDVLPILQKNCQSCHRPGQIGPFSLLSYESTRPWARSIKAKVASRQMPPWFADPAHGTWANDRSLSQTQIDTVVAWVDAGAPQGDVKDAPPPIDWAPDGWQIKPDLDRARPRVPRSGAAGEERHRVDDDQHPERLHEGHVDHVGGGEAERTGRHPPHLHFVPPAPSEPAVLRDELRRIAAR